MVGAVDFNESPSSKKRKEKLLKETAPTKQKWIVAEYGASCL